MHVSWFFHCKLSLCKYIYSLRVPLLHDASPPILISWIRPWVSDFIPIASLLEWQWCRIMRNGQFYHSSRNGASQTTQCREIPHSFPEPFYPVLQVQVGEPTTCPPPLPTRRFHQKLDQVQQILERPSEGGQAPPKC